MKENKDHLDHVDQIPSNCSNFYSSCSGSNEAKRQATNQVVVETYGVIQL